MTLSIAHTTTYRYSQPISLEPQTLHLQPRSDAAQRLVSYSLDVMPIAAGRTDSTDLDGSPATLLWFNGLTDNLSITTHSTVETLRSNPFDFLLTCSPTLGDIYSMPLSAALKPYCLSSQSSTSMSVQELMIMLAAKANNDVLSFLLRLAEWLHESIEPMVRPEGEPFAAEKTLSEQIGSCRDTAVLFMEVSRAAGLAARFVSGYCEQAMEGDTRHLHAWTEVYLPGAGWRGFDPSYGLAVADRHVALAAAAHPALAAPLVGTFRGQADSTIEYFITLERQG